jgi:hypothetical protein
MYLTGSTDSVAFPTTIGAYDSAFDRNFDAVVIKLAPDQMGASSVLYSTFLGGNNVDIGHGIGVGADGHVVVVGQTASSDFPTTPGAVDPTHNHTLFPGADGFITKIDLTPAAQLDAVLRDLLGLLHTTINTGQDEALVASLEAAQNHIESDNGRAAINMLNAFMHKVQAMIGAGALSPAEGQILVDTAMRIRAQLEL